MRRFLNPVSGIYSPEEVLMPWENKRNSENVIYEERLLNNVMCFLKHKVQSQEMVALILERDISCTFSDKSHCH